MLVGRNPHRYTGCNPANPGMEAPMPVEEPYVAEANRLYWETDDSVARIADHLDVSRRALYDAVRPLSTGATCESCGGELTFENRSARKLGVTVCTACETDGRAGANYRVDTGARPGRAGARTRALDLIRGDHRVDAIIDLRDPDLRHRAVVLGSVAIAGVAVGTMAAILATRREG